MYDFIVFIHNKLFAPLANDFTLPFLALTTDPSAHMPEYILI